MARELPKTGLKQPAISGSRFLILVLLAGFTAAFYLFLARFDASNGPGVYTFLLVIMTLFGLYAGGAWILSRTSDTPRVVTLILASGLLFRLILVPAGIRSDVPLGQALLEDIRGESVAYDTFLIYDQDVWRFLWEGHVWASGFNPYAHAPDSESLDVVISGDDAELWSDIRDQVTYPELPSIYPPLAQALFRLSHATFPGSVAGFKLWLIFFEGVAVLFLYLSLRRIGGPAALGLYLFAWNPLSIKVFAGSAHFDVILLAALAVFAHSLLLGRIYLAYAFLGLATLTKFVPALLLLVMSPFSWIGLLIYSGVVVLGSLPFLADGLPELVGTGSTFANEWRFNAGPFGILEGILGATGAYLGYLGLLAGAIWFCRRGGRFTSLNTSAYNGGMRTEGTPLVLHRCLWVLGLAIVLGPVVNPWYVAWLLPFACLLRDRVWLIFTALVFFAFFVMVDATEHKAVLAIEYSIFGMVLLSQVYSQRRAHEV